MTAAATRTAKKVSSKGKRRAQGEGSVYRIGSGSRAGQWCGSISLKNQRTKSGSRKRKVVYGSTQSEVLSKLRGENIRTGNGQESIKSDLTVGEMLLNWLEETYVIPKAKQSTLETFRARVNSRLIPYVGFKKVSPFSGTDVYNLTTELLKKGYSKSSIKFALASLKAALDWAVLKKLIPVNPMIGMKRDVRLKLSKTSMNIFRAEEIDSILKSARACLKGVYLPALHLGIHCGLRRGEILGLQWSDIDFETGWIKVHRSVGRFGESSTKTEEPRKVHAPLTTLEALRSSYGKRKGKYVLTGRDGGYMAAVSFGNAYRQILDHAAVSYRNIHNMRHTFASRLLAAGAPLTTVSAWLGHASPIVTLKCYAHAVKDLDGRAIEIQEQLSKSPVAAA